MWNKMKFDKNQCRTGSRVTEWTKKKQSHKLCLPLNLWGLSIHCNSDTKYLVFAHLTSKFSSVFPFCRVAECFITVWSELFSYTKPILAEWTISGTPAINLWCIQFNKVNNSYTGKSVVTSNGLKTYWKTAEWNAEHLSNSNSMNGD